MRYDTQLCERDNTGKRFAEAWCGVPWMERLPNSTKRCEFMNMLAAPHALRGLSSSSLCIRWLLVENSRNIPNQHTPSTLHSTVHPAAVDAYANGAEGAEGAGGADAAADAAAASCAARLSSSSITSKSDSANAHNSLLNPCRGTWKDMNPRRAAPCALALSSSKNNTCDTPRW